MREKSDRKLIEKTDRIQAKYGGRKPEYILMVFADKLNCLTKALITLTAILAILTVINIFILVLAD
jgi:hypothetical protein